MSLVLTVLKSVCTICTSAVNVNRAVGWLAAGRTQPLPCHGEWSAQGLNPW